MTTLSKGVFRSDNEMKHILVFSAIMLIIGNANIATAGNWNSSSSEDKITSDDFFQTVQQHLSVQKIQKCVVKDNRELERNPNGYVVAPPKPYSSIDLTGQHQGQTDHFKNAELFAAYLHFNSSKFFFDDDTKKGAAAISLLVNWAENHAFDEVKGPKEWTSVSSNRYSTYIVIGSALNALFLLDNHPDLDKTRKAVIWGWLETLIDKSFIKKELPAGTAGFEDKEQRVNNHNATRNLLLALYAIHKNDKELLKQSNKRIMRSFNSVKNGVPYDANRGNWALNYTNLAVVSLTLHTKFYSLVAKDSALEKKVKIINQIAKFLFSETENPNQIHKFARKNVGRPQKKYDGIQDIWWNSNIYSGGLVHFAWIDSGILFEPPTINFRTENRYGQFGGYVKCWFATK